MNPMYQVCASNQHGGGGSTASITTVSAMIKVLLSSQHAGILDQVDFVVSSSVARELDPALADAASVRLRNDSPRPSLGTHFKKRFHKRLLLRGPDYRRREATVEIAGFADATSLPPEDPILLQAARKTTPKWKAALKQRALIRADQFVVQTPSAKARLARFVGSRPIHVIPNSIHVNILDQRSWKSVSMPPSRGEDLRFFYPAGPHPHKNHNFIHLLGDAALKHGLYFTVITTLPPGSGAAEAARSSPHMINIGPQSISSLPDLYQNCDAVFFPSLLETFSATPVEAMYFGRPLLASDRPFVRETVGEYPLYFDPQSIESALRSVLLLAEASEDIVSPQEPYKLPQRFDPNVNATAYLSLLIDEFSGLFTF